MVKLELTQPVVPQPKAGARKHAPEEEPNGDQVVSPGWMVTIAGLSVPTGTGMLDPGIVFPLGLVRAVASTATGTSDEVNSSAHA
jgi:hypothetical protein